MPTTLIERMRPAVAVAMAFWDALADDDDDTMAPLLSSTWDDRPPDFASVYRADRGLEAETCRFLGLASQAELLAADRIRLFFSITDRSLHFKVGTSITAWRLELVEVDGRWLIDRSSQRTSIQILDLSPLSDAADLERAHEPSAEDRLN